MDHSFNPVFLQKPANNRRVRNICANEWSPFHVVGVPGRQIVDDNGPMPVARQLLRGVTAYVASAACDQNVHLPKSFERS